MGKTMYEVNINTEADNNQVCFVSSISVVIRIGVNTSGVGGRGVT